MFYHTQPVVWRTLHLWMIPTPSREYLTYVFLKKIEFRISSAKEQSEQTALKDAADVASQSIESTSSGYHSHISEKNKR